MEQVTYRIESELDFVTITSSLRESNIPFISRKYSDSNFPFLTQSKAFGDISVALENEALLKSRIKELTRTEPTRIEPNQGAKVKRANQIWRVMAIAYMVVITLVCFKYWYINYRSAFDKHNTMEWSDDGQDFIMKNKKTGKLSHWSTDANYDLNFEEVRSYSRNGINVVEWWDKDEDGFYEEIFMFNLNREFIRSEFDRDDNGIIDQMAIVLEGQDTLKLQDSNKNGFLEIMK